MSLKILLILIGRQQTYPAGQEGDLWKEDGVTIRQTLIKIHSTRVKGDGGRQLRPEPLHYCSFAEDACGWVLDPNSWRYPWSRLEISSDPARSSNMNEAINEQFPHEEGMAFCLSLDSRRSSDDRDKSRRSDDWFGKKVVTESARLESGVVQSRVWSPPIPPSVGMRCIRLFYLLSMGRPSIQMCMSERNVELGSHPEPFHMCTFSEDECGWNNDQSSWRHRWNRLKVAETSESLASNSDDDHMAMCLSAKHLTQDSAATLSWLTKRKSSRSGVQLPAASSTSMPSFDVLARLWSPALTPDLGLTCLTFSYLLWMGRLEADYSELPKRASSLALLQRTEG
ncbi:unnamed protein product [Protopolystoma xenopodis]|uniref:MAM domain-containing protein n=1 Tax=Protopolystoma xenopodis TaxID=117903 RepID=A0A3S5ANP1_9PLAT|nr:unnamed protein product [Protopolystoma xenopodis]